MNLFQNIFGKKPITITKETIKDLQLNEVEEGIITKFINSNNDDKLKQVIVSGEGGKPENYKLMKYGILYDPNIDIKFSALKRIHFFKEDPDCVDFLKTLNSRVNTKTLEPYYSMALSRIGIISIEEFKDIFNK